jgi:hypothetical protein
VQPSLLSLSSLSSPPERSITSWDSDGAAAVHHHSVATTTMMTEPEELPVLPPREVLLEVKITVGQVSRPYASPARAGIREMSDMSMQLLLQGWLEKKGGHHQISYSDNVLRKDRLLDNRYYSKGGRRNWTAKWFILCAIALPAQPLTLGAAAGRAAGRLALAISLCGGLSAPAAAVPHTYYTYLSYTDGELAYFSSDQGRPGMGGGARPKLRLQLAPPPTRPQRQVCPHLLLPRRSIEQPPSTPRLRAVGLGRA